MRNIRLYGLLFTLLSLALTSCHEKSFLDSESIPTVDGINVFYGEDFEMFSENVLEDSVNTSEYFLLGLGSCQDYSYIGPVSMDAYIQFALPTEKLTVFNKPGTSFDSVVLILPYNSNLMYRDSMASESLQKIGVYRLQDPLSLDQSYYDYSEVADDGIPLNYNPSELYDFAKYNIPTVISGDTLAPQLRIRLSDAFTQSLEMLDSADWSSTNNFLTHVPGLVLKSETSPASALAMFNSGNMALRIYYHNNDEDNLAVNLKYNSIYNNHFTRVHKSINSNVQASIDNPDPQGEEWNYASYYPSVLTKVTIPFNSNSFLADYVINDAVLEVTAEYSNTFPLLDSLFCYKKVGDTANVNILDYVHGLSRTGYFKGTSEDVTLENGLKARKYQIRVAQELGRSLSNSADLELYLGPFVFRSSSSKIVFSPLSLQPIKIGGTNRNDDFKMKLKVVYSKR